MTRSRLFVLIGATPLILLLLASADLLVSATIRQIRRHQSIRNTVSAELMQEPYRGTDWARGLWEETSHYVEKWDPYYVYRVGEMHGRFINVSNGVRRTYHPASTATHDHLVLVFGASAAWGHGTPDDETLPSWLARVGEEAGELLQVRNYAESGWVNWQGIVYLLERLADGERPELVVFYSGVNEMLSGRQWPQIRRPIYSAEMYPDAMRDWLLAQDWPLLRAWDYYRSTSLMWSAILPRPLAVPAVSMPETSRLVSQLATEYLTDRSIVEALGRQYGFKTLFVWQLTVAAKSVLSAQERTYAGWLPASDRAEPGLDIWRLPQDLKEMYEAIGRTVTAQGVLDISGAFGHRSETAFIDWMHPSGPGNEPIARALYLRLRERLH